MEPHLHGSNSRQVRTQSTSSHSQRFDVFPELESAIASFRNTLQASWTRRAIRMLSLSRPPSALAALTLLDITSIRDTEWEARERAYHDTAIEEVNSLVRRYNGVAPYPVRKPYHDRKTELDRAYQESAEGIMKGLEERIQSMISRRTSMGGGNFGEADELDGGRGGNGLSPEVTTGLSGWEIWEVVRALFKRPEPHERS